MNEVWAIKKMKINWDSLVGICVVIFGGQTPHEIAVVPRHHHLFHLFYVRSGIRAGAMVPGIGRVSGRSARIGTARRPAPRTAGIVIRVGIPAITGDYRTQSFGFYIFFFYFHLFTVFQGFTVPVGVFVLPLILERHEGIPSSFPSWFRRGFFAGRLLPGFRSGSGRFGIVLSFSCNRKGRGH